MKLLVIVLSLVMELFLVQKRPMGRFYWFPTYFEKIKNTFPIHSPWVLLVVAMLPPVLLTAAVLYLIGGWFFGFLGFLFNVLIFYYCLGETNPLYPVQQELADASSEAAVGHYFVQVNSQWFAVIFWYLVGGPLAILVYRLVIWGQTRTEVNFQAVWLSTVLDWLPARMTAFLYLLVGNFQAGYRHYVHGFLSTPVNNRIVLSLCGLAAVRAYPGEEVTLRQAEQLIRHALIVLLVLLALFTLVAWM